jgi:hypothetical protein
MNNSYIINKTYEINELQYYILYVHVCYHFVICDGGPALKIHSLNHSWLRCEDTSSRHMTQPISSHIVLGQPHVLGERNIKAWLLRWNISSLWVHSWIDSLWNHNWNSHTLKLVGVGCSREKIRELWGVAEESRKLGLTVIPSASSRLAREWTPKAFWTLWSFGGPLYWVIKEEFYRIW